MRKSKITCNMRNANERNNKETWIVPCGTRPDVHEEIFISVLIFVSILAWRALRWTRLKSEENWNENWTSRSGLVACNAAIALNFQERLQRESDGSSIMMMIALSEWGSSKTCFRGINYNFFSPLLLLLFLLMGWRGFQLSTARDRWICVAEAKPEKYEITLAWPLGYFRHVCHVTFIPCRKETARKEIDCDDVIPMLITAINYFIGILIKKKMQCQTSMLQPNRKRHSALVFEKCFYNSLL